MFEEITMATFPEVTTVNSLLFFFFIFLLHYFFFIFFNVYLFLRDRERHGTSGGGAEREGDRESETGSRLRAISTEPDTGLKLTSCEIMTRA